jgi:hypothetical protein
MAVICQSESEGDINFTATATDNAGPTGSLKVTRDDVAPTVAVSAVSPNLKAGQDDRIDFNFSEPVGRLHQRPRDRVERHARRPLPGDPDALLLLRDVYTRCQYRRGDGDDPGGGLGGAGSGVPVWFDLAGNPGTASNTVLHQRGQDADGDLDRCLGAWDHQRQRRSQCRQSGHADAHMTDSVTE